jgi:Fe-Mn family superoxide dismutase
MMTRRHALKATVIATAACATRSAVLPAHGQAAPAPSAPPAAGPFKLPPQLPYAFGALEPHIDTRTMEIHYLGHHSAYVANLNKAVAEYPAMGKIGIEDLLKDLNAVPEKIRLAVRNQGGGHFNHTLFWQMMKPNGGGEPKGELAAAINKSFGSFSGFKGKFLDTAIKVFGSGWAWLVLHGRELQIEPTPNQDNPISQGKQPLLGIDVWEHAYYLKHQNRRPDYIAAWFNVINWEFVAEQYVRGLKA